MRNFIVSTVHLTVRVIKYRRLKYADQVARMEEGWSSFRIETGKPTGKRPQEDLDVGGRTILEFILKE